MKTYKIVVVVLCLTGICNAVPLVDEITPRHGEKCLYESCPKTEADILNVHIVPHTHDDVGWLKTVDQYYYGSRNNIQKAGVQYILDSVVKELWEDEKRKFMYVETAFFWKWWVRQPDSIRHKVHTLVRQGRLHFVGGAWSMNDEAATHYQSTVDQFTWGLSKLNQTFGPCGLPRVGWQIDPFGHAREFASILAQAGYDGLFLGRIDYQDRRTRMNEKNLEMVWRGDDDLGKPSDIFTGVLYNTYSPPPGFCFDVLCNDEPIVDDPDSPMYNVDERISEFLKYVVEQAKYFRSNNVILTMGGDFTFQDAAISFTNLDKLIKYSNLKSAQDGLGLKLFYSTPNCYLKAIQEANVTLPTKQDDFFPYASDPTAFWTGYFTSRPTTKYFEREGNNYLQMVKQLQVLAGLEEHNLFVLNELKSAMGVMQHHDAVTGTEKEHVTHDYERLLTEAIDDALLIARQAFNKISQGDALKPPVLSYDRCHFNESSCHTSENSNKFVVTVYNPVAWTIAAVPVRLPVVEGYFEVYGPDGKEVNTQLVPLPIEVTNIPTRKSKATHEVVFFAENLPGLGFKSYYVKKSIRKTRRDIGKDRIKRINDYYANINEYWKNIKDQVNIDIKNIEDEQIMLLNEKIATDVINARIPDQPEIVASHSENIEFNLGKEDLGILKDNKYDTVSKDIEELEKLVKEARKRIAEYSKNFERENVEKMIKYPNLNNEEMRMLLDDPSVVERFADDIFLENELIKLRINNTTGQITNLIHQDGTESTFSIEMLYYPGCFGNNENYANRSSGAYIFRPNATKPYQFYQNVTKIVKGPIVDEVHFTLSDYASGVARIYKKSNLNFIEHEWLAGPIPIDDNIGKEIIVRYVTDIVNNGEFYTDSNGRQMLKRKLNQRPQFNLTLEEPIAGNYYPITNKIYIEDERQRVAVVTDRAQGGSSLIEGNIEIMVHRRLLHDDAFGVGEALNETANGLGLVVRGKHRIFVSKSNDEAAFIDENQKVLEYHLQPQLFVSNAEKLDMEQWLKMKNEFSAVSNALPKGLHLLTLEPWQGSTFLIRIENYLSRSKDSTIQIDLTTIFNSLKLKSIKETTLTANQWLKDYDKWNWNTAEEFKESFNADYGSFVPTNNAKDEEDAADDGFKVNIKAKQIRTFIVDYETVA